MKKKGPVIALILAVSIIFILIIVLIIFAVNTLSNLDFSSNNNEVSTETKNVDNKNKESSKDSNSKYSYYISYTTSDDYGNVGLTSIEYFDNNNKKTVVKEYEVSCHSDCIVNSGLDKDLLVNLEAKYDTISEGEIKDEKDLEFEGRKDKTDVDYSGYDYDTNTYYAQSSVIYAKYLKLRQNDTSTIIDLYNLFNYNKVEDSYYYSTPYFTDKDTFYVLESLMDIDLDRDYNVYYNRLIKFDYSDKENPVVKEVKDIEMRHGLDTKLLYADSNYFMFYDSFGVIKYDFNTKKETEELSEKSDEEIARTFSNTSLIKKSNIYTFAYNNYTDDTSRIYNLDISKEKLEFEVQIIVGTPSFNSFVDLRDAQYFYDFDQEGNIYRLTKNNFGFKIDVIKDGKETEIISTTNITNKKISGFEMIVND